MAERRFDAVLFDWVGTVAHYRSAEERVAAAVDELGRDPASIPELAAAWRGARHSAAYLASEATIDLSAENHHGGEMARAAAAGFDPEFAAAFYRQLDDARSYSIPADARSALRSIGAAGVRIGVVSDFHRDIRPDATAAGLASLVDHWSISCEVGVQKPEAAIFRHALRGVAASPSRTLMVGDRAETDGGSIAVGIPVLLVPPNENWLPVIAELLTS